MTTHGGYQKCQRCGHARDRHDRIVARDGKRVHAGCETGWPRRGAVRSFAVHCRCEGFVEKEATR